MLSICTKYLKIFFYRLWERTELTKERTLKHLIYANFACESYKVKQLLLETRRGSFVQLQRLVLKSFSTFKHCPQAEA